MMIAIAPTRTRALAAARVSSAYAAVVTLLLAPVLAAMGSVLDVPGMLAMLASPLAAWFAVMFLLLALARRAAFVALWLLTLVVWVWQWEWFGPDGIYPGGGFVLWSLAAAPLYAITVVGFGMSAPATRARRLARTLGIAGWGGLTALGFAFQYGFFHSRGCFGSTATTGMPLLDSGIETAWLAMPPLVALDAIRRVCRARRPELASGST